MSIWRKNSITGYWVHERTVTSDTAEQWLAIFRADAPGMLFVISKRKPNK